MASSWNRIRIAWQAATTLGLGWALGRARIAWLHRSGILERRTPLCSWESFALANVLRPGVPAAPDQYCEWRSSNSPRFFFEDVSAITRSGAIDDHCIQLANHILEGRFPFFGYIENLGFPPRWHSAPGEGTEPDTRHWSRIDDFDGGDIKLRWEASRCAWACALARAYAKTSDNRYAEAFWQLLEDWKSQNPPNRGVNWKCGQEASFRVMALCFGRHVFAAAPASTAGRMAMLTSLMAAHAARIDAFLEYAILQKNNHGISEGVGLWTIGTLFPELRGADKWKRRGKQTIASEVRRQIYGDGSYVQHSLNYHRVMLQDLAWALRLGELNNDRFDADVYDRFGRGIRFLCALTDPVSGWAPNYGANDGALVLPLSDCEYPDMRPVLQSCHYIATGKKLFDRGPWDEEMVWLCGSEALDAKMSAPGPPDNFEAPIGGYYTMRGQTQPGHDSWAMIRAARYHDRPSHIDQLHVDLWWRGFNILSDSGTYSYNAQAPFHHAFAPTRFHNTVTIDGLDQMTRLSRFLWTDWANGSAHRSQSQKSDVLEAEHDGYKRLGIVHRRSVVQPKAGAWIIVDDLLGPGAHSLQLHWLLPDVPFHVAGANAIDFDFSGQNVRLAMAASLPANLDLARAGETALPAGAKSLDPSRGWHSRYYGRMEPALSVRFESTSPLPLRFVTVVLLGSRSEIQFDESLNSIMIESDRFDLAPSNKRPTVQ